MASEQITEYERKRLENIKRNSQMLASLKIPSHISDLSATSKRLREEKSYKQSSEKKKSKPKSPVIIRRSLRTRGKPADLAGLPEDFNESAVKPTKSSGSPNSRPIPPEDISMELAYEGEGLHLALVDKLSRLTGKTKSDDDNGHLKSATNFERVILEEPIDPCALNLEHDNVARVVPGRIFSVRFFPTTDMTMVVAGNKQGYLGFWDVKPQNGEDKDVIHLFQPHSAPISGISVHPFALSKVYSCCYDGFLRKMDIEREKFELVYSSTYGSSLFSLAQHPKNVNSVYFGEGPRGLNMFDERVGEISSSWHLHEGRINTIDFSPTNTNIMATSSSDGFACIWDLRNMNVQIDDKHPERKAVWNVKHGRAVHSAYFSPSGSCLATTSLDETIGVIGGVNFEDKFMIPHDNWTNRWVSTFRAVWGWDDTYLYIGNMKRRVDVLSVTQKKMVHTMESSNMSAIPCRYDAHPCTVGMLAGATSGGQIYIWTAS